MRRQASTVPLPARLAIDVGVLRFAVTKLIADSIRTSEQPEAALSRFADDLHKIIDKGYQPQPDAGLTEMIEITRAEIDQLMHAVQRQLNDD